MQDEIKSSHIILICLEENKELMTRPVDQMSRSLEV